MKHGNRLLAVIIRAGFKKDGIEFFVPDEYPQQLGYVKRPRGYEIASHIHRPVAREITLAQEVIFIKSGRVRIDFYDGKRHYAESRIVKKGDVIFLAYGGHGFKFMEEAEIIEVKQGQFVKGSMPARFKPVKKEYLKIKRG